MDKITVNFSPSGRRIGRFLVILRSIFKLLCKFRCYFSEQWKNNGKTMEFADRNSRIRRSEQRDLICKVTLPEARWRGIVVGSAIDGSLRAFIPDPTDLNTVDRGTSASGIAADAMGNIYAADVGAHKLRKYVRAR
jgi:hypothetical protein